MKKRTGLMAMLATAIGLSARRMLNDVERMARAQDRRNRVQARRLHEVAMGGWKYHA